MKLLHLSDLHLGKRLYEVSLLEDQRYILEQILSVADEERPDGVLIAGDIYDKSVAPAEAVGVLDQFLVALSRRGIPTFLISGNHDSPERLAFGSSLMATSGIYISPVYDGRLTPITLTDAYGPVDIYLLPFVKPATVRHALPEATVESYTDAVAAAIGQVDFSRRNVLVTHQFVTGAAPGGSEELSVGGTDNVDAQVFQGFDYVALGHIHGPQNVGQPWIRYCGTPLKYSFSEVRHQKSVTVVELEEKGKLTVRTRPLTPLRDMVELRGSFRELCTRSFYEGTTWQTDFVNVILTDESIIPDAMGRLRSIYRGILHLDYDNTRTRTHPMLDPASAPERKTELALFSEFYESQNGAPMSQIQREYMTELIRRLKEEDR